MVHVQDIHVLLEFFSGIRSVVGSGAAAADMEAAVDQGWGCDLIVVATNKLNLIMCWIIILIIIIIHYYWDKHTLASSRFFPIWHTKPLQILMNRNNLKYWELNRKSWFFTKLQSSSSSFFKILSFTKMEFQLEAIFVCAGNNAGALFANERKVESRLFGHVSFVVFSFSSTTYRSPPKHSVPVITKLSSLSSVYQRWYYYFSTSPPIYECFKLSSTHLLNILIVISCCPLTPNFDPAEIVFRRSTCDSTPPPPGSGIRIKTINKRPWRFVYYFIAILPENQLKYTCAQDGGVVRMSLLLIYCTCIPSSPLYRR